MIGKSNMTPFFVRFLLILFVFFVYFLVLYLGCFTFLNDIMTKVGFSLAGKALYSVLIKAGCCSGFASAMGFALKSILTMELGPSMVLPDEGPSGAKRPRPESSSSTGPSLDWSLLSRFMSSAPDQEVQSAPNRVEPPAEALPEEEVNQDFIWKELERQGRPEVADAEAGPSHHMHHPNFPSAPILGGPAALLRPLDETERRLVERHSIFFPDKTLSYPDLQQIIELKTDISKRMFQLTGDPFWVQRRESFVREGLLSLKRGGGKDFSETQLIKKLQSLNGPNATETKFYNDLKKMMDDCLSFGRYHSGGGPC